MTMTIYDRITGPEMIVGWESFAQQSKTAAGIVDRISMESGISVSDILSTKRPRPIAHARQDAMLAIREELGWSLPRIGRIFGRDHTTVKHGIEAAGERRKDQQTRSTPPNGAQGGQAPQSTDTASQHTGQGPTDLTQGDQK
jgi:chromosomal replication initiation ATPase DnaA